MAGTEVTDDQLVQLRKLFDEIELDIVDWQWEVIKLWFRVKARECER